jgi:hypothetical protein
MSNENTPLFTLPLELRELIYQDILLDLSQGPQILQTCREVYSEARKFLYQRRITFQSQTALNDWLAEKPQHMLQNVHEISLELQDVDLMPLLMSAPSTDTSARTRSLRTWELYENELDALDKAFTKLPNIKTLNIRATSGRQTHLYDDFLAKVLQMLAPHWPALQDLSLEGNMHNQSLEAMESLKGLTAFSFDGFCGTGPAETAATLSRLSLTRVSIVSQPGLQTPTRGQHSNYTTKFQSFDGTVLRSIGQLTSLSISEQVPCATSSTLFITSDILGSLRSHKYLSILSLCLSLAPDKDTLDALNEFLKKNSSVTRLELDWPYLDPAILYILTNRLKSLWIRATSLAVASDILGTVLEIREDGGVQSLRRVVLIRSSWDAGYIAEESDSEDEDEEDVSDCHCAASAASLTKQSIG